MKRFLTLTLIAATLILTFCELGLPVQVPFLQTLRQALYQFNTRYPQEKVYVQLDKPFYKPGEDIWFYARVLDGSTHAPTHLSDVLYVALRNAQGRVVKSAELLLKDGGAAGHFTLSAGLPGGRYTLYAYTLWMKNFDSDTWFTKDIPVQKVITPRLLLNLDYAREAYGPGDLVTATLKIRNLKDQAIANAHLQLTIRLQGEVTHTQEVQAAVNGEATLQYPLPQHLKSADGLLQAMVTVNGVTESISRAIPIVLQHISLKFFPEGGQAVAGVPATYAFKALNEFGKGADVGGVILDEQQHAVASFQSYHMGMGAVTFTPQAGQHYTARIQTPVGFDEPYSLPTAATTGYTLHLAAHTTDTLTWNIQVPTTDTVYLVGQSHGQLYYTHAQPLTPGLHTWRVPTRAFPAGIAVFTLFNAQHLPQCERLVFTRTDQPLHITLTPNQDQYHPREKTTIDIQTTDDEGNPIPAHLSLAVVDDQVISFADDKQDNLLTAMLLSSEVKGPIQEPSFYLDPEEPRAPQALDYLLLTQGWRRFTWTDVIAQTPPAPIVYLPEKITTVTGWLVDDEGNPLEGEVILLEEGPKQRIARIQTGADGRFQFENTDAVHNRILLTRRPGKIVDLATPYLTIATATGDQNVPTVFGIPPTAAQDTVNETFTGGDLNIMMEESVNALEEVIVNCGYYTGSSRNLTGCISYIKTDTKETTFNNISLENALQGRVRGLQIYPQRGNVGAQTHLALRGNQGFIAAHPGPQWFLEGQAMAPSINTNFSLGSMVGANFVNSVTATSGPEATLGHGPPATQGVLEVNTNTMLPNVYFRQTPRRQKYTRHVVLPRKFTTTREFYVPPPSPRKSNADRTDFRTTVAWYPSITTDAQGKARISFYNNDAVSAFRITAEGHTATGLLGRQEKVYSTTLPFSLAARVPTTLAFADTLQLPVQITNDTAEPLEGLLTLGLPAALQTQQHIDQVIHIPPHQTLTYPYVITSRGQAGAFPLSITLDAAHYHDAIDYTLHVKPTGFPRQITLAGHAMDTTCIIHLSKAERHTLQASLTAYPNVLTDLTAGAAAILREPHGCFEQLSSSTFPNILALQFLRKSGTVAPEIEAQALRYIETGYKHLLAYEIDKGGFEWFGHPPAHEGLSAYGLWEFYEMKKVYPGVDNHVIARTQAWLLSRRNGHGGFKQNKGKYGFSAASPAVTNAYITFALAATGETAIEKEYALAYQEALQSKDLYRMALVANTAFYLHRMDDYNRFIKLFQQYITIHGMATLTADQSIVQSYGASLHTEILAWWMLALLHRYHEQASLIQRCLENLLSQRTNGRFGATQATTLALMALTRYSESAAEAAQQGIVLLAVDGIAKGQAVYTQHTLHPVTISNFADALTEAGAHTVRIHYAETDAPLPYSLHVQWYTPTPPPSAACPVTLHTTLATNILALHETVRLKAALINKTNQGLPMTMACIGLPAGLSPQPWQLKKLQDEGAFDFYEITDQQLYLYYREMGPAEVRHILLDLKAEVPGTYTGAASSAYLYYTDEYKDWQNGLTVKITSP